MFYLCFMVVMSCVCFLFLLTQGHVCKVEEACVFLWLLAKNRLLKAQYSLKILWQS